jgi:hypothetical protein
MTGVPGSELRLDRAQRAGRAGPTEDRLVLDAGLDPRPRLILVDDVYDLAFAQFVQRSGAPDRLPVG